MGEDGERNAGANSNTGAGGQRMHKEDNAGTKTPDVPSSIDDSGGRSPANKGHKKGARDRYELFTRWLDYQKRHPAWAVCFYVIAVLFGFSVNTGLTYLKERFVGPSESIRQIEKRQKFDFAALKKNLNKLGSSITGSNSKAFHHVEHSISSLRDINKHLVSELVVARKQNSIQSSIKSKNAGVSGSYSFALPVGGGVTVSPSVFLGLGKLYTDTSAHVRLSTPNGKKSSVLSVGESFDYKNQKGEKCSVALLTINDPHDQNNSDTGSATFGASCQS